MHHQLARRLELSEAKNAGELAEVWAREHPGHGPAVLHIAGGIAAFGGAVSPLSHAVGLGMTGPISEDEFNAVERFYTERGAAPTIDLCPLADLSLNERLGKRGYRISEFNHVLVRALTADDMQPCDRVLRATDRMQWARTVSAGFFEREEFTAEELEMAAVIFEMPAATPFIAIVDGQPAAASVMTIQNRLAMLAGDSTVARFRRRGLQGAMIQARIAYAAAQGCDLAVAATWPGTQSQTNYERLGFRLVYTKVLMTRD